MKKIREKVIPQWRLWSNLIRLWLFGGPRFTHRMAQVAIAAERAQISAEKQAQNDRREVFQNWSLVCAADDSTIIRIRPGTFTIHVQGPLNEAVNQRLKKAWKESSLLIRLPFPVESCSKGLVLVGDWKLAPYVVAEV